MDKEKVEECLATLPTDSKEKKATLHKLHRQFGHPRLDVMMGLLKKVNCEDKEVREIVTNIHEYCTTCKRFSPTPARPVVSLPAASEFGAILTLDLKEVKIGPSLHRQHFPEGYEGRDHHQRHDEQLGGHLQKAGQVLVQHGRRVQQ